MPARTRELACPCCREPLTHAADALTCTREGLRFPIRDGVPALFPPESEMEARRARADYVAWWNAAGPAYTRQRRRAFAAIVLAAGTGHGRVCCEVGAGDGTLATSLRAQGWRTYALDLEMDPMEGAVAATMEAPPFQDACLDLVTMCASLQYVPLDVLTPWARTLRPRGRMLVALTPIHATRQASARDQHEARRRIHEAAPHGALAQRYRHHTRHDIEMTAREAGLDVVFLPSTLTRPLRAYRRLKSILVGGDLARFPFIQFTKVGAPGFRAHGGSDPRR